MIEYSIIISVVAIGTHPTGFFFSTASRLVEIPYLIEVSGLGVNYDACEISQGHNIWIYISWFWDFAKPGNKTSCHLVNGSTCTHSSNKGHFCWNGCKLTHLPLNKMAAISQTTFSNAFSLIKRFVDWYEFHWSLFPRVQLTIFRHWFR